MVDPTVWGPPLWKAFHFVALGYPDRPTNDHMNSYRLFFHSFGNVIPCGKCRRNYQRHMLEIPLERSLGSARDLFAWTVEMHNAVNKETGKSVVTVAAATDYYMNGAPDMKDISDDKYAKSLRDKRRTDILIMVCVGVVCLSITLLVILLFLRRVRR